MRGKTVMYDAETVKMMIEMAYSFQEADTVVKEHIGSDETEKKLSFLCKLFGVAFACSSDVKSDKDAENSINYEVVLKTILSRKWR